MRKIRAAIVGTGFIGPVHAQTITVVVGELVAVVGSTPEKRRRAATAFGDIGVHWCEVSPPAMIAGSGT